MGKADHSLPARRRDREKEPLIMLTIHYSGVGTGGNAVEHYAGGVDTFPDKCPVCGSTYEAEKRPHGFLAHDLLQTLHHCPNRKCGRTSASLYHLEPETPEHTAYRTFKYERTLPFDLEIDGVDPRVAAFSKWFAQFMSMARMSVDSGDPERNGPYQRFALECLVIEYARSVAAKPVTAEELSKLGIASIASTYLTGDLATFLAKRAAWLGSAGANPGRWAYKDFEPLTRVIAAVQHFVAMQLIDKELDADLAESAALPRP
jgi:hypothetical protein